MCVLEVMEGYSFIYYFITPTEVLTAHSAGLHLSVDLQLSDRKQWVKPRSITLPVRTGAPQWCALIPVWQTQHNGLVAVPDDAAYRPEGNQLVLWCGQNHLELNRLKTAVMAVDCRKTLAAAVTLTTVNKISPYIYACIFLNFMYTMSRDTKERKKENDRSQIPSVFMCSWRIKRILILLLFKILKNRICSEYWEQWWQI